MVTFSSSASFSACSLANLSARRRLTRSRSREGADGSAGRSESEPLEWSDLSWTDRLCSGAGDMNKPGLSDRAEAAGVDARCTSLLRGGLGCGVCVRAVSIECVTLTGDLSAEGAFLEAIRSLLIFW